MSPNSMRKRVCNLKALGMVLATLGAGAVWIDAAAAAARPAEPRCDMTLHDGRLTAHVAAAPLRQVLEELQRLSGVQVAFSKTEGDLPVSMETSDVPLGEAVAEILHGHNHVLFYTPGEGSRLTQIRVFGGGTGSEGEPPADPERASAVEQRPWDGERLAPPGPPTIPSPEAVAAAALE